jgi:hypothetical protein
MLVGPARIPEFLGVKGYETPDGGRRNRQNQPLASQFPYASEQGNFSGREGSSLRHVDEHCSSVSKLAPAPRAMHSYQPTAGSSPLSLPALRKHGRARLLTDAKAEAHRPTGAGRDARGTRAQLRRRQEHDFASHRVVLKFLANHIVDAYIILLLGLQASMIFPALNWWPHPIRWFSSLPRTDKFNLLLLVFTILLAFSTLGLRLATRHMVLDAENTAERQVRSYVYLGSVDLNSELPSFRTIK